MINLDSLLRILYARRLLVGGITLAVLALALAITLLTPKLYMATTNLIIDGKGQDPISGQTMPARLMAGYMATQAEVIRSRNVASKVIQQLKLGSSEDVARQLHLPDDQSERRKALLGYLDKGLVVDTERDSNLVNISFKAKNPALAAQIADAFAQAYINTNLELRIEPAKQTTRWYDQQLAAMRNSLVEKQNALSAYQEKHDILVTSDRLDLESAKLAELSSMLIAAQNERLNNTTRNNQLSGKRGALPAEALDNPQVQRISAELAQAQARLSDLLTRVGENHPQYRQAQGEVDSLSQQLGQALRFINGSVRSSVELAESREEQLKAELAAQKDRVLQLSRNRNELSLLKQEVDNSQAAYDAALARATQTKLESQVALTDVSILNTATVPTRATTPRTSMNLVLGVLTGVLLGLAVALCREWMDRRVRSSNDLEQALGLPVLASIPAASSSGAFTHKGRFPLKLSFNG
ncbi:chain length determinant protein EpsF [Cellvibrio sp.]|uniref:chain length determinant protein EpsF n=1 Tax=Cellvibrio sp. TaxID=1965322 RepID=UPI0039647B30